MYRKIIWKKGKVKNKNKLTKHKLEEGREFVFVIKEFLRSWQASFLTNYQKIFCYVYWQWELLIKRVTIKLRHDKI